MPATISLPLLDRVAIASPCTARWEDMIGDDQVRHCAQCNLNVHNLSAMHRDEAERVLEGLASGRVCGRFYRRSDGTILTQDCPVGLARLRAKARHALARVAALIGLIGVAGVAAASTSQTSWGDRLRLRAFKPFSVVCEWISPTAAPVAPITPGSWTSGDMIAPINPTPVPRGPANPSAPPSAPNPVWEPQS